MIGALAAMAILVAFVLSGLKILREYERGVIFRLGRLLSGPKGPGLILLVPFIDQVTAWLDQRIQTTEFNAQTALSKDTVPVNIDAVVFWQIHDPERAALEQVLADGKPKQAKLLTTAGADAMAEVRGCSDALELKIADELWPLPKYREMLFPV